MACTRSLGGDALWSREMWLWKERRCECREGLLDVWERSDKECESDRVELPNKALCASPSSQDVCLPIREAKVFTLGFGQRAWTIGNVAASAMHASKTSRIMYGKRSMVVN